MPGKGEQRRQDILACARTLLVEDGYDGFVLREVAARVGVTLGNLQYYFATRDDLLEAVIRAEFGRNQRDIAALSAGPRPAREKLEGLLIHIAHYAGWPVAVPCRRSWRRPSCG